MKAPVLLLGLVCLLGNSQSVRAQPNDRCALLTQAEAATALGAPVEPGTVSISGCQWPAKAGQGFVQIQVTGARYYQPPPKTAKMISGIGLEAYTYTDMDAPHAMAKTARSTIVVWAQGEKASYEKVTDLLKTVVSRVERE